jgi:hypothetical protein
VWNPMSDCNIESRPVRAGLTTRNDLLNRQATDP